ncbi:MAG: hypothetical protein RBQ97_11335 [Acholeplasma sp.]|nr:hypothetical protein [Acholeplasma sp.]
MLKTKEEKVCIGLKINLQKRGIKMMKNKQSIIIIFLIMLLLIMFLWDHNNYKKIAIKNLETIEWELLDYHNYYVRSLKEINYKEINQATKSLDITINNYQDVRKTPIKVNSEKIIDIIDRDFSKIASSNIISEKNTEQFFGQINKLRAAINNSLKNIKFGDISKESYETILKNLKRLDAYLFEE